MAEITLDSPIEEVLAAARSYWQWGNEPRAQLMLQILSGEVERLERDLIFAADQIYGGSCNHAG